MPYKSFNCASVAALLVSVPSFAKVATGGVHSVFSKPVIVAILLVTSLPSSSYVVSVSALILIPLSVKSSPLIVAPISTAPSSRRANGISRVALILLPSSSTVTNGLSFSASLR